MNFFQVRQYSNFPFRDVKKDKLIKSCELLEEANAFSIAYNTKKDKETGEYVIPSEKGYYVCIVMNPGF